MIPSCHQCRQFPAYRPEVPHLVAIISLILSCILHKYVLVIFILYILPSSQSMHVVRFLLAPHKTQSLTELKHFSPLGPPALAIALSTQPALIVSGRVKVTSWVAVQDSSATSLLIFLTFHSVMAPQPFSSFFSFSPLSVTQLLVMMVTWKKNERRKPSSRTRQSALGVTGPCEQIGWWLHGRSVHTKPSLSVV